MKVAIGAGLKGVATLENFTLVSGDEKLKSAPQALFIGLCRHSPKPRLNSTEQ
jgi:hypothetical protein